MNGILYQEQEILEERAFRKVSGVNVKVIRYGNNAVVLEAWAWDDTESKEPLLYERLLLDKGVSDSTAQRQGIATFDEYMDWMNARRIASPRAEEAQAEAFDFRREEMAEAL